MVLALVLAGLGVALALREINNGGSNASGGVPATATGAEVPGGIPGADDETDELTATIAVVVAATETEAEPAATQEPPSPTPQPPTATPEPEPTPTPEPTATLEPAPTATPEPTVEPEASATPEPGPPEASGPPTLLNSVPPEWQEGQFQSFGRDDFVGGGAYRRDDGVLYDRPAAHLYARSAGDFSTSVTFSVDERPNQHLGLVVIGMDDERPNAVPCRISLNDKVIWEGPSPFANEQWTEAVWEINALGWLREGENSLTIEIMTAEGEFGLPPWILLNEATVYWN